MIRVENLTHVYLRGTPMESVGLRGVTLAIEAGERVGIIGPTGSGKSTLVQHFNGLLRPTEGKVYVDGADIHQRGVNLKTVRQMVGLLFQYPEHQLFDETVADDVAFGPRNLGLDGEEVERRVTQALEAVGLDPQRFARRSPFTLSGGEMRRAAIAGVLAMEPRVLVLDEPIAGLDPRGRRDLLARLAELHRRRKITLVVVSHSVDEIVRVVDRLVVMHGGRVAMDGRLRQVFARAEELAVMGLRVPTLTDLLRRLRARGLDVRTDAVTEEEARAEVLRALKASGRSGRQSPAPGPLPQGRGG
ncbi:MAG: energy-coupling factor transporter ATPase [Armatimonadetes bacterium]|nr:energy-coupling factor transporter ATPase [Armatimonadota bacterium]